MYGPFLSPYGSVLAFCQAASQRAVSSLVPTVTRMPTSGQACTMPAVCGPGLGDWLCQLAYWSPKAVAVPSRHGGELASGRCHPLVCAHDGVATSVQGSFVGFDPGVGHVGDAA